MCHAKLPASPATHTRFSVTRKRVLLVREAPRVQIKLAAHVRGRTSQWTEPTAWHAVCNEARMSREDRNYL